MLLQLDDLYLPLIRNYILSLKNPMRTGNIWQEWTAKEYLWWYTRWGRREIGFLKESLVEQRKMKQASCLRQEEHNVILMIHSHMKIHTFSNYIHCYVLLNRITYFNILLYLFNLMFHLKAKQCTMYKTYMKNKIYYIKFSSLDNYLINLWGWFYQ